MSTIPRTQPVPAQLATIAAVWTIARSALRAARPDLVAAVPPSRQQRPVLLRIRIAPDTPSTCEAEIEDTATGSVTPIELGPVRVSSSRSPSERGEYLHTDVAIGDRRIAAISVASEPDAEAPAYAVTDLLGELGIQGGRYSRPAFERAGGE